MSKMKSVEIKVFSINELQKSSKLTAIGAVFDWHNNELKIGTAMECFKLAIKFGIDFDVHGNIVFDNMEITKIL